MRTKGIALSIALLAPLLVVGVLTIFGITFSSWVYLLLAFVCLASAGVILFVYKKVEKELDTARRGVKAKKN